MTAEIYAILHDIRSLYNVGSLFRTCNGAGVTKLFLTGITGQPPRKEIRKTALGAEDTLPWEYHQELEPLLASLRVKGIQIIGVEQTQNSHHYLKLAYQFPVCFIFGNEVTGLEKPLLEYTDQQIYVPMYGEKESLNVAVCGGIVLYGVKALSEDLL